MARIRIANIFYSLVQIYEVTQKNLTFLVLSEGLEKVKSNENSRSRKNDKRIRNAIRK